MKRTRNLIVLSLALLLLASCGDPGIKPVLDENGDYAVVILEDPNRETRSEEITTLHPGELPIDRVMEKNLLNYRYPEEADASLPVMEGWGVDKETAGVTQDVVVDMGGNMNDPGFKFILRSVVDPAYREGGVRKAQVLKHARCGDVFLLSLEAYDDGYDAYYLYDMENGTLKTLGRMESLVLDGNYFVARPLEDGPAAKGVVLDWQGKTVHTYRNAVDFDFWGDYMYILTKEALYRVPESAFYDEKPALEGEKLCETKNYDAWFSAYTYGVLALLRKDGGDLRVVPLDEAAEAVAAMDAEPTGPAEPIKEACDAFEVSLPAFWKDHYTCTKSETGISFAMTREDGEPLQLFELSLHDYESVIGNLSNAVFYAEYAVGEDKAFLAANAVQAYPPEGEEGERYWAMLVSMDSVAASLQPKLPDAEVHTFDFTERLGEYAGKTALGDEYRLTLGTARYNILAGRLTYATPAGLTGAPEISVVMFGDEGLLAWKDESGSSGIATVRFTDEGLMLELQGDGGWSKTEEFALEKQES